MISPTILYPQMKKWVATTNERPLFQHIYFSGEKAYATDSHHLVIVKNYPVKEPHYETPEGYKVNTDTDFPPLEYETVLIQEKDIIWQYKTNFGPFLFKDFIQYWKTAFDFMLKVSKKRTYKDVILQKKGNRLLAYLFGDVIWLKGQFILLDNLENDGKDWQIGFNAAYLLNVVDFLKATEPETLKMYVNKQKNTLTVETEDLLLLTTGLLLRDKDGDPKPDFRQLVEFVDKENVENKAEETDEDDIDFLG